MATKKWANSWIVRNFHFRHLLKNTLVLYFLFFLSIGNLLTLAFHGDGFFAAIFIIAGFLTSFFSKNMIVILFVAISVTNLLKYGSGTRTNENLLREGLETGSMSTNTDDTESTAKITDPEEAKEKLTKLLNNSKNIDEETKKHIHDLLDTQLKLVTGVTEMKPLLDQTLQLMESLKQKSGSQ